MEVNTTVTVTTHFHSYFPQAMQACFEAGVVNELDGKVLKPFYLIEETRTCDDEFGYLGYGDCLPPTYSVEFDLNEVKRQIQAVEKYNRDPESSETIFLAVTRIIPSPLQRRNNGLVVHKEF